MLRTHFLELPPETLVEILRHVDLMTHLACKKTCRALFNLILESPALQYYATLQQFGMVYNASCSASIPSKLVELKQKETEWLMRFGMDKRTNVSIKTDKSELSSPFCITPTAYVQGLYGESEDNRDDTSILRALPLLLPETTSLSSDDWISFTSPMALLACGLAIESLDLIVPVAADDVHDYHYLGERYKYNKATSTLHLTFLQCSTMKPHPLARFPVVSIPSATKEQLAVIQVEICGENLVLLAVPRLPGYKRGFVYILDWRTADSKRSVTSYSLAF